MLFVLTAINKFLDFIDFFQIEKKNTEIVVNYRSCNIMRREYRWRQVIVMRVDEKSIIIHRWIAEYATY